jgi:serpin B
MYETEARRSNFANRLYDKLANTHAGMNLFLSPFSIRVALAMCAVGARGETRHVMTDLIGAPEDVEDQNRQYGELLKSISGESDRTQQLIIANALWGQQGYHFKAQFKKSIADFYAGAFNEVNYREQPDEAVKTINRWVSEKTREKIKDLLHRNLIRSDTSLILTNAIYFKGQWEKIFEMADTRNEDWQGPRGMQRVSMMHQRGGYLYYECDNLQALNLPYRGRKLSMMVVLPKKKDGLAALERQWIASDLFQRVTSGFDPESVIVSLPRFKIQTECNLKTVLCALHVDLPFSDDADFSDIGDEPLKISEVIHKAFVEVNEFGTEAAVATAVGKLLCTGVGSQPPQPKVFKADHPFLFFIWDRKTDTVFFSGRVLDPG